MSPLATGVLIGGTALTASALAIFIRDALSDSECPIEPSNETIEFIQEWVGEDGQTFENHKVRAMGAAVVREVAGNAAKFPKDLEIEDLPAALPTSAQDVIDYLENFLEVDVTRKQAKKIVKRWNDLVDKDEDEKASDDEEDDSEE